jgi:hypothetical protein
VPASSSERWRVEGDAIYSLFQRDTELTLRSGP